jgi:hypothetical protein
MAKNKKIAPKSTKFKKPAAVKKVVQVHNESPRAKDKAKEIVVDRRMDRQDRRNSEDRRKKNIPVAIERRVCERRVKVNRRRQIDPTTCERDYTIDEIEFMNAMEEYKRTSGRMFPTCSEVLEVIKKIGYGKQPAPFVPLSNEATLIPDITPPLATF